MTDGKKDNQSHKRGAPANREAPAFSVRWATWELDGHYIYCLSIGAECRYPIVLLLI